MYHLGLSVFGSRNQAKNHRLRTVQRSCVPDLTSHTPPPLESIAWAARSVGLPSPPNPSAGESGVGGERVV